MTIWLEVVVWGRWGGGQAGHAGATQVPRRCHAGSTQVEIA